MGMGECVGLVCVSCEDGIEGEKGTTYVIERRDAWLHCDRATSVGQLKKLWSMIN